MRMGMGIGIRKPSMISTVQRAIGILKNFGTDAHLYIPGATTAVYGPELAVLTANSSVPGVVMTPSKVSFNGSEAAFAGVTVGPLSTIGKTYKVAYTFTGTGQVQVKVGGVTVWTAAGVTSRIVTAIDSSTCYAQSSSSIAIGYIDNISVKEVTFVPLVINGFNVNNYIESTGNSQGLLTQPVGLVLDSIGAVSNNLLVNGDFSAGLTGWAIGTGGNAGTAVVSNGEVVITSVGNNYGAITKTISSVIGRTYRLTYTARKINATIAWVITISGGTVNNTLQTTGTNQTVTTHFTANSSSIAVILQCGNTSGFQSAFSNIELREVTGIHATQSATANAPKLQQTDGINNWTFDGTSQYMTFGAPPFQLSNDYVVVMGLNSATNNATNRRFFSMQGSSSGLELIVNNTVGTLGAKYNNGTASTFATGPSSISLMGKTSVISLKGSSSLISLSVNSNRATPVAVTGSSNFTAVYLASTNSTNDFFAGNIYPLITIKGTVSDSDLLILEKFIGILSGVNI
jgi:hypothetical protein